MTTKLEKEVRFLKNYALVSTLLFAVLLLSAFAFKNNKFEEISVERLNIVEKDGKLKLVLTNDEQTPGIFVAGKVIPRGKQGGMYFYNEEGDEVGGLVFNGKKEDGTAKSNAGLFFDQYQQDQIIGLVYNDYKGRQRAGLIVQDQPKISAPELTEKLAAAKKMPDGAEKEAMLRALRSNLRVYVGKTRDDNASSVLLFDAEGRSRIKMTVQPTGEPKLEFLDADGKVIYSLPEKKSPQKVN